MRRGRLVAVAAGIPLALAATLGVEAYLAIRAEYLPTEPHFVIDQTVGGDGDPLRLVVLGDSTVAGVGADSVGQSLPVQVATRVAEALGRPVHVVGLGVSGARTADVLTEQVPLVVDRRADVVVIVVGSNDVTHVTLPGRLREQTAALLRAAVAAGDMPVVLGGIPLFEVTAFAEPLRTVVDGYASVLRRRQAAAVATVERATFVDISRLASPRFAGVPESMSADRFHPAGVGYGFWADALAPAVVDALRAG